jgi:hypothetical protein
MKIKISIHSIIHLSFRFQVHPISPSTILRHHYKMHISASVASVLLFLAPALIGAAPADGNAIFGRDGATCNPPKPKAGEEKKYNDLKARMDEATRRYKMAEISCPGTKFTEFNGPKDVVKRTKIKNDCVEASKTYVSPMEQDHSELAERHRCATERKRANERNN